jgi:hypothetical protein
MAYAECLSADCGVLWAVAVHRLCIRDLGLGRLDWAGPFRLGANALAADLPSAELIILGCLLSGRLAVVVGP